MVTRNQGSLPWSWTSKIPDARFLSFMCPLLLPVPPHFLSSSWLLPLLCPPSPPILFHHLSLLQSSCSSLVILGSYDLPWSFLLFQTSRSPHEGGKKVEAKSGVNGQSWFFIHLVECLLMEYLWSHSTVFHITEYSRGWERGADIGQNRSRISRILVRDKGFLVKLFSLTPLIDHGQRHKVPSHKSYV